MKSKIIFLSLLLGASLVSSAVFSAPNLCDKQISIHCGKTPSGVLDSNQRLWLVFVQRDQVFLTFSDNVGKSFSSPVAVNTVKEKIYTNGENRPKVALGKGGEILVSWTKKTEGRFSGNIRFSRSLDGGKHFSDPVTVNNDGLLTSHRFDQLHVTASGLVYLAWIDKRDKMAAAAQGDSYAGAALYYAVSDDSGASFSANHKVVDHSCECCRIGTASHGEDGLAVFWRQLYNQNTRDHGIAILQPDGRSSVNRATYDEWQIDACPHHGPHIARAKINEKKDGTEGKKNSDYHLVWFSNGDRHRGIYYGKYDLASATTVQLHAVDQRAGASHPQIASQGDQLYLIWKLFDGQQTRLQMIRSHDGGKNWEPEHTLLTAAEGSDHPLLLTIEDRVFAGWLCEQEGFRFVELD